MDENGTKVGTILPPVEHPAKRQRTDSARPSGSALGMIMDMDKQRVQVKVELADTKKELENVKDSEEMQRMVIPPLEEMRRDMKTVLLATKNALLQAGVPSKQKPDTDVPFYYDADSWRSVKAVPWNEREKLVTASPVMT